MNTTTLHITQAIFLCPVPVKVRIRALNNASLGFAASNSACDLILVLANSLLSQLVTGDAS